MDETRKAFKFLEIPVPKTRLSDLHFFFIYPTMTDLQEQAQNELKDIEMSENFFTDDEDEDMNHVDNNFSRVNIDQGNTLQHRSSRQDYANDPVFLYRMFYNRLFPFKTYFQWLNYDTTPTRSFTHREFSFTLLNDIYIRFKSFPNADELKKEIERIQPVKIDIGAIYAVRPNDKKTVSEKAFRPLEKELVFDIDMTDYDEVRTCCSGGDVCMLCWEFMTVAIKVIDTALRDDFGFEQIMWVYSGRRGVHCWVCDESARKLDNDSRKAIVSFLDIIKGGAQVDRKVKLPPILHPSLKRSFDIVNAHFDTLILSNMGILDKSETWNKLLAIIPDAEVREKVESQWTSHPNKPAAEKWGILEKEVSKAEKKKKFKDEVARDIKFQYCYPRLDVKVTTAINHLLKSPFCVHPKTCKVLSMPAMSDG
ncbi:hypothetical protein FB192DRAFT_1348570 [Mucor lusitanicus]|uniref:DNA primase n=1 Tax=Mucor circinelloides f. lusitanicus TaxID=29924 RepID=A0A8H4BPA1_MUCCL|nr:hypothetical protein FB192DRAFT_1348570 [Mucor lusitanicus]